MQISKPTNSPQASTSRGLHDSWCEYVERSKLKDAWVDWIEQYAPWQTACCWHLPEGYRAKQTAWNEDALTTQMRKYFEVVERRVFKHSPRTANRTIKRFITKEYSDSVGWHAHGLLGTPAHYTDHDFRKLLEDTWVNYYKPYTNPAFMPKLIYLEDLHGKYIGYAVKQAIQVHEASIKNQTAKFDLENCRLYN